MALTASLSSDEEEEEGKCYTCSVTASSDWEPVGPVGPTLEAEPWRLGLKRQGDGERKMEGMGRLRPPERCRLTGWYEVIMEPASSKLLLWLLSFTRDRESSSSADQVNDKVRKRTATVVLFRATNWDLIVKVEGYFCLQFEYP